MNFQRFARLACKQVLNKPETTQKPSTRSDALTPDSYPSTWFPPSKLPQPGDHTDCCIACVKKLEVGTASHNTAIISLSTRATSSADFEVGQNRLEQPSSMKGRPLLVQSFHLPPPLRIICSIRRRWARVASLPPPTDGGCRCRFRRRRDWSVRKRRRSSWWWCQWWWWW